MNSYSIHGGHNPSNKIGCGAVGLLNESVEDRKICKHVVKMLKKYGFKVTDCTVNNGKNQSDVLVKIGQKEDKVNSDFNISIHLNSGRNDKKGDGSIGGTENWLHKQASNDTVKLSSFINWRMFLALGKNRGIKYSDELYILNHKKSNSLLIEVCFVDDKDDYNRYNYKSCANAIIDGILLFEIEQNIKKNKWLKNQGFKADDIVIHFIKGKRYLINKTDKILLYKNRKKIFL